ncbi:MAG: HAD hydrolase-like protein, partial [Oscillospiraceae bacterium]
MKLPYDALLFDLDGTLTDSAPGIIRSLQAALHAVGVEVSDPALLRSCVGPPLSDSFRELFHLTPEQSATAFLAFRARFETVGIFENSVYDGIPALLGRLRAAGYRLGVATSKPELFARKILEHFELSQEFSVICGASLDESRNQKREVIEDLLTQTGLSPARVL